MNSNGCGSFAIEAKAQSFNQIDGVLSAPTARIRGDIDNPAGYPVHPRQPPHPGPALAAG
jgi:hypothetical protein